ncbi:carboxymuconolactone decarboxylase family protein [Microbacterium album]|uniref:4-carboxymuconolactone decarboxylase n=1 Tax=Microbacterium album TaxID=2053191 RepID=A0A917IFT7_9MICO|nr:carboxymuconolactone decarboxylase family protein [Microbacterium album]GGH44694.1 4-carboxymuconolactone decarboxylase [Microbacterium album]
MDEDHGRFRSPVRGELDERRAAVYDAIVSGPRAQRTRLTPLTDEDGRLLGPFGPMLLAPGVGDAVQELGAAIRFRGELDDRRREIAILTVAECERSGFEWFAHEPPARAAGVSDADIEAVRAGREPGDEALRIVWRIVRDLVTRGALDDDLHTDAVAAVGAEGIAELIWLTGHYRMLATALRVFDPPVPAGARDVFR